MKHWWQSLTNKQQSLYGVGLIFSGLLLFYSLVWIPIADKNKQLVTNVADSNNLLQWMKPAVAKVKQAGGTSGAVKPRGALLPQVQMSLRQSTINSHLSKISMGPESTVNLSFDSVPFDALVLWLETIEDKKGLTLKTASLQELEDAGVVQAQLQLG